MKSSIFTLTLILTFFLTGCETELNSYVSDKYYYKLYGTFHNDHMQAIHQLNDGWLLVGSYEGEADSSWAFVCKSLPDGMMDWDTAFNDNMNAKAYDAIYTSGGDILVAVAKQDNENKCYLSVVEMSIEGTIDNTTDTLVNASLFKDLKIRQMGDGTIRLFSLVKLTPTSSQNELNNIFVHDYYPDSGLVENVSYEIDTRTEDEIVVTNRGNTSYLGFTFYENEQVSDAKDIRLMAICGKYIEWNSSFGSQGVTETCSDILVEDQGLTIAGNYSDSDSYEVVVLNTDFNGYQLATTNIQFEDYAGQWGINSMTVNDSNNFVFTGEINTGVDRTDIIFLETTRAGGYIRDKRFGSFGESQGNSKGLKIKYLENSNNYILAGELAPINNTDICVFSLDRLGNWIPGE